MADESESGEKRDAPPPEKPVEKARKTSGVPGVAEEEVGSTQGRSHDNVLDQTLDPEVARKAKLKRDRSGLQ